MRASQVEPACHEESTSTVHQDVPRCDFPTLELTAAMFRRFCRCLPCRRGSLRGASLSLHRCQAAGAGSAALHMLWVSASAWH